MNVHSPPFDKPDTGAAPAAWQPPHAFHYAGGPIAVVLIHGLTGTPAELKLVAKGFARAGYSVYGVQLAGHCGSEAELLATGWKDWLASALEAFDRVRTDHHTVFVGGLSMGALLSLLVTSHRVGQAAGCLLYSPTMFYDGWSVPRGSVFLHAAILLGLGLSSDSVRAFPTASRTTACGSAYRPPCSVAAARKRGCLICRAAALPSFSASFAT
jgi:carboxylesterase